MRKMNSYAIVSFFPVGMTGKTLFQFYKGVFSEDEKMDYIIWFLTQQGLLVDDINLDASLDDCKLEKNNDPYIDWNTCSRSWFNMLKSEGILQTT